VAKQYQNQGLTLPDLINEGNLGLIKAATRFDETRGFKFISYAVWWIRQSILQALAEQSRIVRLPLNQVGSLNRITKASAKLEQEFGRPATSVEIADYLELPLYKVKAALKMHSTHVSMDAPLMEGETSSMLDIMINSDEPDTDEYLIRESLNQEIERSLSSLTEKERDIINLYYGIGYGHSWTLDEIAIKFGLTRERVRQIKEKAIRRLKHNSRSKLLKAYLGQ
jgi:RNA polymerase primary sigma factor